MEFFGVELTQIAFLFMVAVAVGGLLLSVLYPYFSGSASTSKRVKSVTESRSASAKIGFRQRLLADDPKDARRKQLVDSLNQSESPDKARKKRLTLRLMLQQAGLQTTPRAFWLISLAIGAAVAIGVLIVGLPLYAAAAAAVVGSLGLPRWFLKFLRKRRQNIFLTDFADAIDVMVRGLKAGLPITDAMKIISTETGPPVGPEFMEIVEGQRIGITIDQGLFRMFERMPLPEVNFLGIVMAIQSKTGGNLSEALGNLSRVLRDRKKMKQKIKAVSQEAKASAAIIGSLPFCIMAVMTVVNPEYLNPLWFTRLGNILVAASAAWMTIGVLIMRKMINFEI